MAVGLIFHPIPAGGFEERPSVLANTPNGWVMHPLTAQHAPATDPLLYDAFNRLLIGYGWLGNPLFLAGLTGLAALEIRYHTIRLPPVLAWGGFIAALARA